ncbi:polysaccharide deacetylase [Richelia sinica FACHB-800]|uniref:Polysaccharide deacetylase n=1 Tax=Richelia sinica FACHB-800 TaxID=1357546 RepID=A0A975T7H6_9NOST|nr:polysaccharide deacetylase family protein [Richelia sinica]MBD2663577.1 polysaccharide deacetylase family protein [Richelia sinica FACHB-800]QXE22868.1 polysaccharide deacetylase [Richelia sinica FACHB-800]
MTASLHLQKVVFVLTIALSLTACTQTSPRQSLSSTTNPSLNPSATNPPSNTPVKPTANLAFTVPPQFQGKTVYQVSPKNQEKVIALTIDDGPWPKTTPAMLNIFQQNGVKATFFWVGTALQAHPDIAKQVAAQGHAIGNHTWHHWYRKMDAATAKSEIERTAELIYKTTGVKTSLFRPPGGFLNNGLAAYAKSKNYSVIMWSLTSADTDPRAKPQAFVNNVLKGAKPGAIVLMHDGGGDRHRTVEALPKIISGLKQQGYRFVTVPELLAMAENAKP